MCVNDFCVRAQYVATFLSPLVAKRLYHRITKERKTVMCKVEKNCYDIR